MINLQTVTSDDAVLIITHNYSGGSAVFLDEYVASEFKNRAVFVLQSEKNLDHPLAPPVNFKIRDYRNSDIETVIPADVQVLNLVTEKLHVTEIFVNHLIHFNLPFIVKWIMSANLPTTYFIHDYHCVCLNYHIDCDLKYCELSKVHPTCRHYLKGMQIWDWQKFWFNFLGSPNMKIIAPSKYAASFVKKTYPNLSIEIRPHRLIVPLQKTFDSKFATREKLRITFLGNMFEHKGEEYLLKLNEFIRREKLPAEFVVIGKYHDEVRAGTAEGIIFTGEYDVKKISVSEMLAKCETGIVAVLSNVAETYNYTASEAILSGYPVLSLNIGAHAFRVIKNNCGWVIPFDTEDRGVGNLKNFLRKISSPNGRLDILTKAENTANFQNGDE